MRKIYLMIIGITFACTGFTQIDTLLQNIPDSINLDSFTTYDGTGQAVHPDIIYFKNGFNGHHFYMTMTPYAASNGDIENPSVIVSDNGYQFYEEQPGMNPLALKPPIALAHNDDPDFYWNAPTNEFWLYYLETSKYNNPKYQKLQLLKSSNGTTWTSSTLINYNIAAGEVFILAPSVVKKDSVFYLYYVNNDVTPRKIQYLTSPDGLTWDKTKVNNISITFPTNVNPWHTNILDDGNGTYYMLCDGYVSSVFNQHHLYLAVSTDMVNWNLRKTPIISAGASFYNCNGIFRSTGIIDAAQDLLIVYATVAYQHATGTADDEWRVAIKKINNVSVIMGINDKKVINDVSFTVYPNPSDAVFTVSFKDMNEAVDVSVANLQGELVYSKQYNRAATHEQIDLSGCAKGMYFIKVQSNNTLHVKKIEIQ